MFQAYARLLRTMAEAQGMVLDFAGPAEFAGASVRAGAVAAYLASTPVGRTGQAGD
ncbi:MAG: hypothetical protein HY791_23120 [Deltaproteobacteria bacterium]|nr:hypothetical protein [Deltaproteobacteria bacterium]